MATRNFEEFLEALAEVRRSKRAFGIITLVGTKGSSPQEVGARAIVGSEGLLFGTVGGGAIEKRAIQIAQEHLRNGKSAAFLEKWNLRQVLGMSCGGEVTLFFEIHQTRSDWQVAVIGAGHVAQELVRTLLRLECSITCGDTRDEWLSKLPSDERLKKVHLQNWVDVIEMISPQSFLVVMTMGHSTDFPIVQAALEKKSFPYIGVIGSKSKAHALKTRLIEAGVKPEVVESLVCPIGEEFGNDTPPEIALSIVAQLLKRRDARRASRWA